MTSQPAQASLGQQSSTASQAFASDVVPLLPLRPTRSNIADVPLAGSPGSRLTPKQASDTEDQLPSSPARIDALLDGWEPPDDKAARLAHIKTHYHHELFTLSDTKTQDLAEFGQGLALYFYFLKWTAMLLAAMSLVVLPNTVCSAIARQRSSSTTGMLQAILSMYSGKYRHQKVVNMG